MKKKLFLLSLFVFLTCATFAQQSDSIADITKSVKITSASVEVATAGTKRVPYHFYTLHFTLVNNSPDTLVFITNSCPTYNRFILKTNDSTYETNSSIWCSFNESKEYVLAPNDSFSLSRSMHVEFAKPVSEIQFIALHLPMVVKGNRFTVAGWNYPESLPELIFEGEIPVVVLTKDKTGKARKVS